MPLVALSELRGNQSDFCPALRQINRHMEQGSQDIYVHCRSMLGMWTWQVTSLYRQIRPADSCLLLLLPRSQKFVFVYQRNVCGAVKDGHCLKFHKKLCLW